MSKVIAHSLGNFVFENRMVNRLKKELESITKNYTGQFRVTMPNNDFRLWHVMMSGAEGTIFEGEEYK